MPNKKDKAVTEQTPEDKLLEAKVDAMMDPKHPDTPELQEAGASDDESTKDSGGLPPLDIFVGATTAPDLPKDLAVQSGVPETEGQTDEGTTDDTSAEAASDISPEPQLDDAVSDAAVDDIVAHESDTVLAAEDADKAEQEEAAQPESPRRHRHPIFWALIALIVVAAIAIAVLLVSGGNWQLPGSLQHIKNTVTK